MVDSVGWIPVTSSNVAAIRWADWHALPLQVKFLSGAVYGYAAPFAVYDAMFGASSQGKFVWHVLRARRYAYRRLA